MKRIPERIKDVDDDENDSFEGHNLRSSLHKELVEDKVSEWSNPADLPQEFSEDLLRITLRRGNGQKYRNMKSTPERIKTSKIEYTSLIDDQDTKHDMGKSALSARSNSIETQASSNNYEASQIRKLNIERVRGVHYVEYAVGRPQQRLRFALALNSPYTVFRCSQYVRYLLHYFLISFPFLNIDSYILNEFPYRIVQMKTVGYLRLISISPTHLFLLHVMHVAKVRASKHQVVKIDVLYRQMNSLYIW